MMPVQGDSFRQIISLFVQDYSGFTLYKGRLCNDRAQFFVPVLYIRQGAVLIWGIN